jgi:hypothetical protein
MRALARAPADRFATAAEFGGALEARDMVVPQPLRRRRGALVAALAIATALVLGAAWVALRPGAPPPVAARSAIAILPFAVRGNPALGYLGEGMVELLSTKLDRAGDLRAVDPRALLSAVRDRRAELGQTTHAPWPSDSAPRATCSAACSSSATACASARPYTTLAARSRPRPNLSRGRRARPGGGRHRPPIARAHVQHAGRSPREHRRRYNDIIFPPSGRTSMASRPSGPASSTRQSSPFVGQRSWTPCLRSPGIDWPRRRCGTTRTRSGTRRWIRLCAMRNGSRLMTGHCWRRSTPGARAD